MKRSLFVLVAALAAFATGCQNTDINNPASTNNIATPNPMAKPHPEPYVLPNPNLINFSQKVLYTNNDTKHNAMNASGTIFFNISQSPILRQDMYDVLLEVKGEIRSSDENPVSATQWTFGGTTKDRISISKDTKVTFVKRFMVQGTEVSTVLSASFTVTANALALGTISLTEVKISPSNDDGGL